MRLYDDNNGIHNSYVINFLFFSNHLSTPKSRTLRSVYLVTRSSVSDVLRRYNTTFVPEQSYTIRWRRTLFRVCRLQIVRVAPVEGATFPHHCINKSGLFSRRRYMTEMVGKWSALLWKKNVRVSVPFF